MDRYEYMKIPLALFPDHIVKQYNLFEKAQKWFYLPRYEKSNLWPPPSGIPRQQAPQGTAETPWIH